MTTPRWALFDLNGTLLDPRPLAAELPGSVDGEAVVLGSLQDAVVRGMVDTLSGEYRPFLGHLRGALERRAALAGIELDDGELDALAERAGRMPPFADGAEALSLLRAGGVHPGVLTNSAEAPARTALEAAGLADQVEALIASDGVRAYKPATRVYEAAVERLEVQPEAIVLVSAHWWDVTGAKRAGLRAGWVSAKEGMLMPGTPRPDYLGAGLAEVARSIVRLGVRVDDLGARRRAAGP